MCGTGCFEVGSLTPKPCSDGCNRLRDARVVDALRLLARAHAFCAVFTRYLTSSSPPCMIAPPHLIHVPATCGTCGGWIHA